jgi:hypothetical protein
MKQASTATTANDVPKQHKGPVHPFISKFWPITRVPQSKEKRPGHHDGDEDDLQPEQQQQQAQSLVRNSEAATGVMHDLQYIVRYMRSAAEVQRIAKEKQMLKDYEKQQELARLAFLEAQSHYLDRTAKATTIAGLFRRRKAVHVVTSKRQQRELERVLVATNRFLAGVVKLQTLFRRFRARLWMYRQGFVFRGMSKYRKSTSTGELKLVKSRKVKSSLPNNNNSKASALAKSQQKQQKLSTTNNNNGGKAWNAMAWRTKVAQDCTARAFYQRQTILHSLQERYTQTLHTISANIWHWERESQAVDTRVRQYESLREMSFQTHREMQAVCARENLSNTQRQKEENDKRLKNVYLRFERMNERVEVVRSIQWWLRQHLRLLHRKRALLPVRLQDSIAQMAWIAQEYHRLERIRVHVDERMSAFRDSGLIDQVGNSKDNKEKNKEKPSKKKSSKDTKLNRTDPTKEENKSVSHNKNNKNNKQDESENDNNDDDDEEQGEGKQRQTVVEGEGQGDGEGEDVVDTARRARRAHRALERDAKLKVAESDSELMQAPLQWLSNTLPLLLNQCIALDAQQESLLREELVQIERDSYELVSFDSLLAELVESMRANDLLLAERVALDQALVTLSLSSPDGVRINQQLIALKGKQKQLSGRTIETLVASLREKHDAHDQRLLSTCAFPRDQPDLSVQDMRNIDCHLLDSFRPTKHIDVSEFLHVFVLQPWLATESVEDIRYEERIASKEIRLNTMREEERNLTVRVEDATTHIREVETRRKDALRDIELFADPVPNETEFQREKREETLQNAQTEKQLAETELEIAKTQRNEVSQSSGPLKTAIQQVEREVEEVRALLKTRVKTRQQ